MEQFADPRPLLVDDIYLIHGLNLNRKIALTDPAKTLFERRRPGGRIPTLEQIAAATCKHAPQPAAAP